MDSPQTVSAEEFFKVELKVGKVLRSEFVEGSDKLIRLTVSFGEHGERNILTGLKAYYEPSFFEEKLFVFAYNLAPRTMMGEESAGMLLCVDGEKPLPLEAPDGATIGAKIK
jgi:methionine--tRNA ligase beta chain